MSTVHHHHHHPATDAAFYLSVTCLLDFLSNGLHSCLSARDLLRHILPSPHRYFTKRSRSSLPKPFLMPPQLQFTPSRLACTSFHSSSRYVDRKHSLNPCLRSPVNLTESSLLTMPVPMRDSLMSPSRVYRSNLQAIQIAMSRRRCRHHWPYSMTRP